MRQSVCNVCSSPKALRRPCPVRVMSSSSHADRTEQQIQAMLRQAREEGKLDEVMRVINASFSSAARDAPHGMSDGSKRQRDNENDAWKLIPVVEDAELEYPSPKIKDSPAGHATTKDGSPDELFSEAAYKNAGSGSQQAPIPKALPKPPPLVRGPRPSMPLGIHTMEQWGQTLCELPKVKGMKASYADLVTRAQYDLDLKRYMTEFVMKHNGPSPKVRDFRAYLEGIRFPEPIDGPPSYLAGSRVEERKFKH